MSESSNAGKLFETPEKSRLKYFDTKMDKSRHQGKSITASEAERLAREDIEKDFGKIPEESDQINLRIQKPSRDGKTTNKLNKKTLNLDTILDGASAWASWIIALFNAYIFIYI